MFFYRIVVLRFIKYFKIGELSDQEKLRLKLLGKKPKKEHKLELPVDERLNLWVSILHTILNVALCFSIPYVVLESPVEPLKEEGYIKLYLFAKTLQDYTEAIDRLILLSWILLVAVSIVTLADGISKIDTSVPYWVAMDKYAQRKKKPKKKVFAIHFAYFKSEHEGY